MVNQVVVLLIMLFLTACDYEQRVEGVILDKDSKQPIGGVSIKKENDGTDMPEDKYLNNHSDQSGAFLVRYRTTGLFSAPDLKLSFSKEGFQAQHVARDGRTEKDTVYLERAKK